MPLQSTRSAEGVGSRWFSPRRQVRQIQSCNQRLRKASRMDVDCRRQRCDSRL